MTGTMRVAALGAALWLVCACKPEGAKGGDEGKPAVEGPGKAPGETAPAEPATGEPTGVGQASGGSGAAKVVEKAPPPKLYDKPVERRLYSDRIESSSFLWTDWNKFQENYHPSYLMDGDPATAWVEGADSSGAGEWVRVQLSPVEGVTRIRLRVQNGYHKSKALYDKNARARQLAVTALPGGQSHTTQLADDMKWQEIAFDLPAARVEALQLQVVDVYEGTKYTDLCISEVEIFLTGLTVENPAFEKAKLEELVAWKKNRLAAAALFGSKKAAALPILPGYRVVKGDAAFASQKGEHLAGALDALIAAAPEAAQVAQRATQAVVGEFPGWRPVQVVARPPLALPPADGLYEPGSFELVFEPREDAFMMPSSPQGVLLSSRNLSLFDTKEKQDPRQRTDCKEGKTWYMRPPRAAGAAEAGPLPSELLMLRCVVEETREGEGTYTVWQLLEFDAQGNLVLLVGPQHVQWFEWKPAAEAAGGALLTGGVRITQAGEPVQRLVDARVVARD